MKVIYAKLRGLESTEKWCYVSVMKRVGFQSVFKNLSPIDHALVSSELNSVFSLRTIFVKTCIKWSTVFLTVIRNI